MINLKKNKILVFFFIFGLLQIFYLFNKRSNFNFEILKNPLKKDSYVDFVLEEPVIEAKKILKSQNLEKFNLSKKLNDKNSYFYQRVIEYSYPSRMDTQEKYTFFMLEEASDCKEVFKGKFVELKKCN